MTHAPSAALAGVPAQQCQSPALHGRDQRGLPRATSCTIGAVELPQGAIEPANPPPLPGTGAPASSCQLSGWTPPTDPLYPLAAGVLIAVLLPRRLRRRRSPTA